MSIGSWVVILIIAAIVCFTVVKMVRDKKSGKGGCNCGCSGCSAASGDASGSSSSDCDSSSCPSTQWAASMARDLEGRFGSK